MGKATQDLRKEHEAILYVLTILAKMMASPRRDAENMLRYYGEVVDFFKIFADKCHHGKEELYLFKELVAKGVPDDGGPVGAMLREHVQARDFIAKMARSIEEKSVSGFHAAAVAYGDLLRRHIEKENDVLFVMADKLIDEEGQNHLFEEFEQHEENVIGHGVHEKLHDLIHVWAKDFDVT